MGRKGCKRRSSAPALSWETPMPEYTLPDLPYDYGALEPHYSAKILELHHDKHHAAYVKGANEALEKLGQARDSDEFGTINQLEKNLAFNLSGHVLHSLFWQNIAPGGGDRPEGELGAAIDESFGSFDRLRNQLSRGRAQRAGLGLGRAHVGAARPAPHRRAGLRPPEQRRAGRAAAARARHVGARVLPAVPQREGRLGRGVLEHRELARRRRPLHQRAAASSCSS